MDGEPNKAEFLIKKVNADITEMLTHYQYEQKKELIDHLTSLLEEVQHYYQTKNPALFKQCIDREVILLEKYGADYTPYEDKHFFDLFDTKRVLLDKGYYTAEEFNALPEEVTALKAEEVGAFCNAVDNLLSDLKYHVFKEKNAKPKMEEQNESDTTEMQQLLAVHYILKAGFNIEARGSNSVSQFTQLAHLLLGKKFTTLQNSNIYKKYKKLPNFDSPAQLIKDLKHLRPYFERLEMKSVVELINKDLQEAEGDKKHGKK